MADPVEKRAAVGGVDVLWREAAATTPAPVLYLHGVPTSGSDWVPFLARTGGLALAQDAPELIERLVVIDAVPFLPGYRWHTVARIWRTPVLGELFMGTTSRRGARFLARRTRSVPEEHVDTWIDEHLPNFDHGTQRAILRLYRSAPS